MARSVSGLQRKSTAKLFVGSKSPNTKYRDRDTVTAPDGTTKDIQGYGRTKDDATAAFIRKAEAFIAERPSVKTITFAQLIEKYLVLKEMQGKKRKTISDYRRLYTTHLTELADKPISHITLEDVQAIQYRLVGEGKYRTAELVVLLVKSSYRYAKRLYQGQLELHNPAEFLDPIPAPHKDDPKDAIWSAEQIERFLALSRSEYEKCRSLYYPLYLTALSAGLRRGELLGLRWEHVGTSEAGPYIKVREQYVYDGGKLYLDTPKSAAGLREIPITEELHLILMAHRELLRELETRLPDYQSNDLVFPSFKGWVVSPGHLRRSYNSLIARAELPPIYFHSLRKCAATYITQALVDAGRYAPKIVAQILGHARVTVAQEIYTRVVNQDIRLAVFNPLSKKVPVTERLQTPEETKR